MKTVQKADFLSVKLVNMKRDNTFICYHSVSHERMIGSCHKDFISITLATTYDITRHVDGLIIMNTIQDHGFFILNIR